MRDWEDDEDEFELFGDEETTDMGDEPPKPIVTHTQPKTQSAVSPSPYNKKVREGKPGRRVKIKPMPQGMRQKWPDVVSCLLTLSSGKQVMFVKGE